MYRKKFHVLQVFLLIFVVIVPCFSKETVWFVCVIKEK
jgi:hypothetical protein